MIVIKVVKPTGRGDVREVAYVNNPTAREAYEHATTKEERESPIASFRVNRNDVGNDYIMQDGDRMAIFCGRFYPHPAHKG